MPRSLSRWLFAGSALTGLLLATAAGCQKANRYAGAPPRTVAEEKSEGGRSQEPSPVDERYAWQEPPRKPSDLSARLEFVHATKHQAEWDRLKGKSWVPSYLSTPGEAATVLALPGLAAGPLVAAARPAPVLLIRVPLGLDDPADFIPSANPPTLAKWELGRRLFFDRTWLHKQHGQACADCHVPGSAFADRVKDHDGANTLPLINAVYNRTQFWDGRATYLEEVVQRSLEDEREPAQPGPFRHVFHGVMGRLWAGGWAASFDHVFGTRPTQDAVGKALATYMRTILSGDSLHDRAVRVQQDRKGQTLEQADYEAVLDEPAIEALGRKGYGKVSVAGDLHLGYVLFHNIGDRKANCIRCHSGATFSDGGFHNLGIWADPSLQSGRFVTVPVGLQQRSLVGAYRTPTLRSLSQTGPYMHTGELDKLEEVVRFHARGGRFNSYLDPIMADERGDPRDLALTDAEVQALLLFLKALEGSPVDEKVRTPPPE
jgi:cytochrome c peroxidase